MYLLDTNVISERRKQSKANPGVIQFFDQTIKSDREIYISVITIGELRRGIELIRHRNDLVQAKSLENWLDLILVEHADNILDFGPVEAQVWGRLRVPHYENALDKQIAATALTHDLTLVTRNEADFSTCGLRLLNPFN